MNGWTPERRQRQRELIAGWAPWQQSTGPRTRTGKARSAQNALKSGDYSAAAKAEYRRSQLSLKAITFLATLLDHHPRVRYWSRFSRYSPRQILAIACGVDDEDDV